MVLSILYRFYSWLSKDFHSMGRLNIGSTGHRNMCVGVGLGSSSLDAKGGIVGGTISLSTIDTFGIQFKFLYFIINLELNNPFMFQFI